MYNIYTVSVTSVTAVTKSLCRCDAGSYMATKLTIETQYMRKPGYVCAHKIWP